MDPLVAGVPAADRPDPLGRGKAAECRRSETLAPRTESADRVVSSVCPYCAVGCAQRVYVTALGAIQIENQARI